MHTLGIALNTRNFAPSQYGDFNFNSLCVFKGVVIGAGEDGIMELSGDTFNGTSITAFFQIASTDLGIPKQKKVRSLVLSGEQNGNLSITVINDNVSQTEYSINLNGVRAQGSVKVDLDSDDIGRFVGLLVENVDGQDFSIDAIDMLVLATVLDPATSFVLGRTRINSIIYTCESTGTV